MVICRTLFLCSNSPKCVANCITKLCPEVNVNVYVQYNALCLLYVCVLSILFPQKYSSEPSHVYLDPVDPARDLATIAHLSRTYEKGISDLVGKTTKPGGKEEAKQVGNRGGRGNVSRGIAKF